MSRSRVIGLVHNEPLAPGQPNWESSADVMVQVEAIETSLAELGHAPVRLPFSRDLGRFVRRVEEAEVSMVFNLCETVDDDPQFAAHPAAVLELLGLPFTGSPSPALMATTDKHRMKLILQAAGVDTPAACLFTGGEVPDGGNLRFPVILKPQFQDASIGIDQDSVITDPARLAEALQNAFTSYGPIVVEEFIGGREFNVSLLGSPDPAVLPAAEIDFSGLPDTLFKIVGYRAKWEPASVEYQETRRIFPELPAEVAGAMAAVARRCFRLFGLRDYGRVDLRLEEDGRMVVLEINANPCLSPDAGFPAAVRQGGLDYTGMVQRFVAFVNDRSI